MQLTVYDMPSFGLRSGDIVTAWLVLNKNLADQRCCLYILAAAWEALYLL